ncbi:MAG TPA: CoA-transferase, partial [Turneriella sp.]|nr:CoA-transferase [Turneriella sp.]
MNKFLDILNAAYKFVETGADVSWVRRFTALGKAYLSGVESDITYVPNKKDLSEALQNKIMSAQRAAGKIRSKSTVISCGFGAMARPSVFFKALKFIAEKNKSPLRLTWVTVSAAGARGRAAGSLEDLAIPGLIERYITGHVETVKAFVPLVSGGQMAWDMLPQGVITQVLVAQAQNKNFVETETGLGTYVEKQIDDGATNLVTRSGDKLRYTLPRIGVAIVVAASVDNEGNISAEGAASLTEMADAARAAEGPGIFREGAP